MHCAVCLVILYSVIMAYRMHWNWDQSADTIGKKADLGKLCPCLVKKWQHDQMQVYEPTVFAIESKTCTDQTQIVLTGVDWEFQLLNEKQSHSLISDMFLVRSCGISKISKAGWSWADLLLDAQILKVMCIRCFLKTPCRKWARAAGWLQCILSKKVSGYSLKIILQKLDIKDFALF